MTDEEILNAPPAPDEDHDASHDSNDEQEISSYAVTLPSFHGPLDLLLHLIKQHKIDIYDIPIVLITEQYTAYLDTMEELNLELAADYIYMAALLIHIKSKMLLPRDPSAADNGEAEDPRRELVERLLEHERFKAAAQMLMQKQQIEEATWSNPGIREFKDDVGAEREIAADTVDLVRVFQDILSRMRERPILNVDEESVTVAQMIDYVKRRLLMEDRPMSLRRLLHNTHTERALICMFLAMLELVRLQAVLLHQPVQQGDILIKKTSNFDTVFADQQQARDDWK